MLWSCYLCSAFCTNPTPWLRSGSPMDKLKAMSTFVAIVDQGSLAAAADKLDRSPAAVVRTSANLEQHLGVRLLNRTTRRMALTNEGQEYLEDCRRILADIQSAESKLEQRRAVPAEIGRASCREGV